MVQYAMDAQHQVDLTGTYRAVITRARGEVEGAAIKGNADMVTTAAVSEIFNGMASVFDIIDAAKNQAASVGLQNPDLNDEAVERKYRPVVTKAVAEAKAARDKVAANIAALERTLEAATKPKLPAGADAQMQLLNMKQDLKMLFDSIHEASLLTAMLEELAGRIRAGDEIGVYLLGSDRWPAIYLRSRGRGAEAYDYSRQAAAALKPLQSETIQAQATILSYINCEGGLKALLANIDQYLYSELPALEATTARSWSTDALHRY